MLSLQADPTAAGKAGSLSSQSSSAQTPSPSASPPKSKQAGLVSPAQVQPSSKITSLKVASLLSLQAEPIIAGTKGSLSSQSSSAHTPSLSASKPASKQGGITDPAQVQPSSKILSFIVLGSLSSQGVPKEAGREGSLSSQSTSAQKPSPSASLRLIIILSVASQPLQSVMVTEKVPAWLTVIVLLVSPVDQLYCRSVVGLFGVQVGLSIMFTSPLVHLSPVALNQPEAPKSRVREVALAPFPIWKACPLLETV